jgi:cellulose synthase (UDP-forming)
MGTELLTALVLAAVILLITGVTDSRHRIARAVVCALLGTLVCTYLTWRIGSPAELTYLSPGQRTWQAIFFGAEVVCCIEALLFFLQMSRTRDNTAAANELESSLRMRDSNLLPEVDVWIATYNEEWPILEKTIVGALNLDYPKHKIRILILDDGRRAWLAAKCSSLDVEYITRPDSRDKKAGNHNHALSISTAPFILSLDADFVPFPNFLFRTLGFFNDTQVAVVQTPQTYYNVDAMRSSMLLDQAPDELAFFYREEQPSRDAWDAAFYCGSCAVLRRSALIDIGGFVTATDIEDLATSVKLCANGYKARYLNETLSVGLSAESLAVLHDQRNRWCRGSLQVVFSRFGPFGKGLGFMQRILFRQSHWLVWSVIPILFLIAPALLWLLEWRVYTSRDTWNVLWLPIIMLVTSGLAMTWLARMRWHPILSPAMQIFLAIELIPTALTSVLKPFGRPLIRVLPVTPKGSSATPSRVDLHTFVPLAFIVSVTLASLLYSLLLGRMPLQNLPELAGAVLWTVYALMVGVLACLMCFERPYRRGEERFAVCQPATVLVNGKHAEVLLLDVSLTGARVTGPIFKGIQMGHEALLTIPTIGPMTGRVVRRGTAGSEVGLLWEGVSDAVRHRLIRAIFTDPTIQGQLERFSSGSVSKGLLRRYFQFS